MNNEQLQNLFHFDDDDLSMNRRGELSPRQKKRLLTMARFSKLGQLFFGLLTSFVGIICVILSVSFIPVIKADLRMIVWPPFFLVFAIIGFGIGVIYIRRFLKKTNMALERAEGPCNIIKSTTTIGTGTDPARTRIVYHELFAGGQRFRVPAKLALYVMQGDICAIYFVRGLDATIAYQNIMSFEVLSN